MFRQNWRGAEEWQAEGLPIKSSTSNEAIKLYDCALTQLVCWYDDAQQENGLAGTLTRMSEADPNFVLGRALALGIELIGTGTTTRINPPLQSELNSLKQLADQQRPSIEWREWAHVQAVDRFASGKMQEATQIWEDILLHHPTDLLALKMAHDTYFYLGAKAQIRDSVARVLPVWTARKPPLTSYLHGMYAFGLEETHFYARAEREARLGLSEQPHDAWSTHAMAHCFEMATRPVDGLAFLSGTVTDWSVCNLLACHNFWHWALYHVELDEPEAAAEILEKEVLRRAGASGAMLDLVDACSLLYRLELLHPNAGFATADLWKRAAGLAEPHVKDHILGFNDAHFAMACLGVDQSAQAEDILEGIKTVQSSGVVSDHWLDVTQTVLGAMIDYKRERYDQTVDKLWRVKYSIVQMGGSDAQRDVFSQLLIVAAIRANNQDMCRSLLHERKSLKGDDVLVRKLSKSIIQ